MLTEFPRTLRSLRLDRGRFEVLSAAAATLFVALWIGWVFFARLTLVEVSSNARLEVDRAAHRVHAPLSGLISTTHLALDREVAAGDILAEIESEREQQALLLERAKRTGLAARLVSLDREIAAQEEVLSGLSAAGDAALLEAEAKREGAEAQLANARREMERVSAAPVGEVVSETEVLRRRTDLEVSRSTAHAFDAAKVRLISDQRSLVKERQAHIAKLGGQRTDLQAQAAMADAQIAILEREVQRRQLRAPIAGKLADIATLHTGSFVREGELIATIVPRDVVKVVAAYRPADALGRVRIGQAARVSLAGFPWTQHGMVLARVSAVAGEVRDGIVRVELSIAPDQTIRVPLEHGMPGSVEIEVEALSPATLILRTVGLWSVAPSDTALP